MTEADYMRELMSYLQSAYLIYVMDRREAVMAVVSLYESTDGKIYLVGADNKTILPLDDVVSLSVDRR